MEWGCALMTLTSQAPDNVTQDRNKYVGGSDIPVILGLSKFKTQYQLALEKTSLVKTEFVGNEYTQFGNAMEPQIREYINITTDFYFIETSDTNEELRIRSNTDGVDRERKTLLEIKTHGKTPSYQIYNAQMQLYMYHNDLEKGLLALYERPDDFDVEFDSERLQINNVVRNEQFINEILKEIELFWKRVYWLKSNEGASEHDYNNCLLERESGGEMATTELAVKTSKLVKPEIEFNYDELAQNLEENLKKYDGLTFTEATAKDCKATITELNKGKKLVDEYRLKTKKQLLEPVKEFEDKCKDLNKKFDEVISPLKEQADAFEEKRKEEKRTEINKSIDNLLLEFDLTNSVDVIEFDDKWLNKSTSMKTVERDIIDQIDQIKLEQEKEQLDKDLIKSHVELVNAKNDVELLETSYLHLAGHTEKGEIKRLIEQDSETLVKRRKEEQKRKEQEEQEKQQEKQQAQQEAEAKPPKPIEPEAEETRETGELFIEVYEVTGTTSQLDGLEEYMSSQGLAWKVVEE